VTAHWRSIVDWSALVTPPGGALMGAFKGYFDESGQDAPAHNALAFCGYVTTIDGWKAFEDAWDAALKANGAPYLHMKELHDPKGPLAKFAGKENQDACKNLLADLIKVIATSSLTCAGSLVRLPDLREFNAEYEMNLEALPLAMYATMGELHMLYPLDTLELICDRLDDAERIIAKGVEYSASFVRYNASENMRWSSLKGQHSFRNVLPIQAADFVAWEARKEHEKKNIWWKNKKRGLEPNDWLANQGMWLGSQGKSWPDHRRSFFELSSAVKVHAGVIDYDFLCKHHNEIRHRVWTMEARREWWRGVFRKPLS
jgi:hypothetical protein